jgi:hypothetical protein
MDASRFPFLSCVMKDGRWNTTQAGNDLPIMRSTS